MPYSSTATKRLPGCRRCRSHHLRCDRQRPACSTCRNAKGSITCIFDPRPLRFSHSKYSLTAEAIGTEHESAHFPGETGESSSSAPQEYGDGSSSGQGGTEPTPPTPDVPNEEQDARRSPETRFDQALRCPQRASNNTTSDFHCPQNDSRPLSNKGQSFYSRQGTRGNSSHGFSSGALSDPRNAPSNHSSSSPLSPITNPPTILKSEPECQVFAFYITHVGYWPMASLIVVLRNVTTVRVRLQLKPFVTDEEKLDIGSPKHYFQCCVPRLAVRNTLVLYACLACAAQIMYRLGKLDQSVEERYNAKVLELLIPLLSSDQATSANEPLLATTVILRMAEQFLELGQDAQRHLNGAASLFLDGTEWPLVEHNLAIASFWTHLRESIRICFLQELPPQFDPDQLQMFEDDVNPAAPEEIWSNRMTILLLRVCKLCWSTRADDSPRIASRLQDSLDFWKEHLPWSYRPWSVQEVVEQPFPMINYFESWQVMAWQFYYTAKIMLAVYFSTLKPTNDARETRDDFEAHIISPTRLLCGLCMSATNPGTNVNGSHLMAWSGQFLLGHEEQVQVLKFLTDLEKRTSWPNRASSIRLQESWKRARRSWIEC